MVVVLCVIGFFTSYYALCIDNHDDTNAVFKRSFYSNIKYSGMEIDTSQISDLSVHENKIVFRYTEECCISCVRASIGSIQKVIKTNPSLKDKLIIIGGKTRRKLFENELAELNLNSFDAYNAKNIGLAIDENKYPYFFILGKDKRVYNIFVPDKSKPIATTQYLNFIMQMNEQKF